MAGRKQNLTPEQWSEIAARRAKGETVRALAKAYGVSPASISEHCSDRVQQLKTKATQLFQVEAMVSALPIAEQNAVRSLADKLKSVSSHAASAAEYGMMTAHRLSQMAHAETDKIDPCKQSHENAEVVKSVMVLTTGANEASKIGLNLLAANKDAAIKDVDRPLASDISGMTDAEVAREYERLRK